MFRRFLSPLYFVCVVFLLPLSAQASVVIDATRIIYPIQEREVSIRLTNHGQKPAMVQAWVDDGNPDAKPDDVDVPFVVTPPLTRINQDKGQTLRLAYTPQAGMPKDRESVFWLNVLDVPPLPVGQGNHHMQLAFRSRLKVFVRPADLPGNASEAAQDLRWSLVGAPGGTVLQVRNDSAFHVSFHSVVLQLEDGRRVQAKSSMLTPKSTANFVLDSPLGSSTARGRVLYEWISDHGSAVPQEARVAP